MSFCFDNFYAIGDVQGCLQSLDNLLAKLPADASVLFIGDLVNRGPDSLGTLRRIKEMHEAGRALAILGNHDLHLLSCAAGHGKVHRKDTISDILEAPDRKELITWLRNLPLIIDTPDVVFAHAGIPPTWSLKTAKALAKEVHEQLSSKEWKKALKNMYGNDQYVDGITGHARMRSILNGFTRMRFLEPNGNLDFHLKEGVDQAPEGFTPWFDCPRKIKKTICFGHWSLVGLKITDKLLCIDTGCLWGRELTAVHFPTRQVIQEHCPMWANPSNFG